MSISADQVRVVARLSRLEVSEEALAETAIELSKILNYVDQLSELDTSDVPPTRHVGTVSAPFRSDEPQRSGVTRAALSEAPRTGDGGFLVPGFIDES
jgi:aspartyl-tRNA(Asn)/glutamyl-tRNA(Gln) amidotransferase subunit C